MTTDIDKRLREPFPPDRVGKLPKPYQKNAEKGHCNECGKWHGLPALHLDYVGHGAITERLLDVDPDWNWEPLALEDGVPRIVNRGGTMELWIRLTIGGRTRIGVGTCPNDQFDAAKVLIGDALRNAGMRFGLALDLWIKGDDQEPEQTQSRSSGQRRSSRSNRQTQQAQPPADPPPPAQTPDEAEFIARKTNKLKADLLERIGDIEKAKGIWRSTLQAYGLGPDDLPKLEELEPIEAELRLHSAEQAAS